jgi:hypothetical protein
MVMIAPFLYEGVIVQPRTHALVPQTSTNRLDVPSCRSTRAESHHARCCPTTLRQSLTYLHCVIDIDLLPSWRRTPGVVWRKPDQRRPDQRIVSRCRRIWAHPLATGSSPQLCALLRA